MRVCCQQHARVWVSRKVYENALAHELRKMGLAVAQQRGIVVTYDGIIVGEYAVDLLVEAVLVELKAVKAFDDIHQAQCLNYLRASGMYLCLLLNFGKPCLDIRRVARDLRSCLRSSAFICGFKFCEPGPSCTATRSFR